MRKLLCSLGSPFARKVRVILAEKGLDFEMDVGSAGSRPLETMQSINPNLTLPALIDKDNTLFDSNVIVAYLLETYPDNAADSPLPPLAPTMTRPSEHWEDAKTLATIETMANTIVNLRFMTSNGLEPERVPYLQRQQTRIRSCLDWLERRATPEGFAPGLFSIMDVNFISAVGYAETRHVAPWRGRTNLEAIVKRYENRPSILTTKPE